MEFHDLPNEVQLLIFDRLNFRTRLTASRVSRHWNRLAFSSRFLRNVQVSLEITHSHCLVDAISVMQRSERAYQRIKIVYHGNTQQSLPVLPELLRTLPALKGLELLFYFYCFKEKLNVVIYEILASCPILECISIGIRGRLMSWIREACPDEPPQIVDLVEQPLCFPSLTRLIIKRNPDLLHPRFYERAPSLSSPTFYVPPEAGAMPNLRELAMNCDTSEQLQLFVELAEQLEIISVISFDPECRQVEPFFAINFPMAKSLKLPLVRLPFFRDICRFLRSLRKVEILEMEQTLIDDEVIDTMLQSCTQLRELSLYLESLGAGCLKNVAQFERSKDAT